MPSDTRIAQPWVRDLKSAGAKRFSIDGELVASIAPHSRGWKWAVLPEVGMQFAIDRDAAKEAADAALRRSGWELVNVAGCTIEG